MGRTDSNKSLGAAAMMVRLPAVAPTTPPDTGESTKRRPVIATRSAMAWTCFGGQVAIRQTIVSAGAASNAPFENSTASAWAALTTINTMAPAPAKGFLEGPGGA